jgi:hypothetical protein
MQLAMTATTIAVDVKPIDVVSSRSTVGEALLDGVACTGALGEGVGDSSGAIVPTQLHCALRNSDGNWQYELTSSASIRSSTSPDMDVNVVNAVSKHFGTSTLNCLRLVRSMGTAAANEERRV